MAWLRRRHLARKLALAAALLAAIAVTLQWSRREEPYVPGQAVGGVVDELARSIPQDAPPLRFTDVTEAAGIRFRHFPAARTNRLPEDMGSGVALGDVDGDGWTDVFLVNEHGPLGSDPGRQGAGRCALFRNRGDGTFEDKSAAAGVDLALLGMAAAFLDADSDGDLDLLVSGYGELHLFANDGAGRFEDRSREAGLADLAGFWTGIAVGDYDRDGAVDAYVCGYVRYADDPAAAGRVDSQFGIDIPVSINPSSFEPERNLLLRGRGDGTFEEVAARLGVANEKGRSLGAFFADLTGDGWPDLYVANDVSDNAFYVNRGDGTFEDRTAQALVGDYRGAMGLAVADFDGDLDQDFFVTHWVAQENALYVDVSDQAADGAGGPAVFMDLADRFGLGMAGLAMVGWATGFTDLDRDGRLDLFVVNGSTIPVRGQPERLEPMRSQLFWRGPGRRGFYEIGAAAGDFFREEHVGRGGAVFDFDLDGDDDLLITVHGGRPRLLRNDGVEASRSLLVRLRQPAGNTFALGAWVEIESGGRIARAQTDTQGSYLSQHAVGEVSFGLGEAGAAERLAITWPDGTAEEAGPVAGGSLVTWTRGSPPRIEPLPGAGVRSERPVSQGSAGAAPILPAAAKSALAAPARSPAGGPTDVAQQRVFYDLQKQATGRRLAGDHEEAVGLYRRALELWPAHEDCLYYLGNTLAELGRAGEAVQAWEALVAANPASSRAWMQIGQARLAAAGGSRELLLRAREAFERSHAIHREESLPLIRLGSVDLLLGDLQSADRHLADAARSNARTIEAPYLRGRVAWLRGDAETARRHLEEAHERARAGGSGGTSVLDEGATKAGSALTARRALALPDELERWRSLLERPADPELEYGAAAR